MSADSQIEGNTPPGVGCWKVVIWTSLLLAGPLSMLDPVELFSHSSAPNCIGAPDHVRPAPLSESVIDIGLVPRYAAVAKDEDAARLFGMDTEPVAAGALSNKRRLKMSG
jgi:hypothetical protein